MARLFTVSFSMMVAPKWLDAVAHLHCGIDDGFAGLTVSRWIARRPAADDKCRLAATPLRHHTSNALHHA